MVTPLPENVEHVGANLVQIAAYLTATSAIVAMLFHRLSPLRRVTAWLWRRNVSGPVSGWAETRISATVAPLVEASRAASLAQHEEQNTLMAAQSEAMAAGFSDVSARLDKGAEIMAEHTEQIASLERKIEPPRLPDSRTRSTDNPPEEG